jgi:hypothetical protein
MGIFAPRLPLRLKDADGIDLWLSGQRSPLTRSVYRRDINRLLVWTDPTLAEGECSDSRSLGKTPRDGCQT